MGEERNPSFLGRGRNGTLLEDMGAIEMLCVGHIWNLARLRRAEPFEYAMDDFRAGNTGNSMVLLECLRQCWE
jgi:hypothetical protein